MLVGAMGRRRGRGKVVRYWLAEVQHSALPSSLIAANLLYQLLVRGDAGPNQLRASSVTTTTPVTEKGVSAFNTSGYG